MLLPAGVVSPSVPDLQPLLQSLVDPGNTHDKSSCNGCIKHPLDDRLVDRITRHGEGRHHIESDADNGGGVVNPDVSNQQRRPKHRHWEPLIAVQRHPMCEESDSAEPDHRPQQSVHHSAAGNDKVHFAHPGH